MMWSIVALMYFADIAGSISAACVAVSIAAVIVCACVCVGSWLTEVTIPWLRMKPAMWAFFISLTIASLLPSKQTIYAGAAGYVGERVASTEEFALVRQIVTRELRKLAGEPAK